MPQSDYFEYPCLVANQESKKLVCFKVKAKELWSFVSINERDSDKDEGYQRTLSTSRVNQISKYIDKHNYIPNNILISLSNECYIDKNNLYVPKKSDMGWVIDGQHRLAGAKEAQIEIELIVVAFINLSLDEQVKQFVTINREGKGVPTSLYYDLMKHLPTNKSDTDIAKERAVDIASALKKDENSVFYERIIITSPKNGEISLNNFVRKIFPLLNKNGKLHIYSLKEQEKIIDNYFTAFQHVFPKYFENTSMLFFKTLGFGAIINALPTIFDITLTKFSSFAIADIIKVLKTVDYFNFEAWEQYGSGTAAEKMAGDDLIEDIKKMNSIHSADESIIKL
ncbi:MAG: DGQHR domain-containing protein [Sulfurimonas sp.]